MDEELNYGEESKYNHKLDSISDLLDKVSNVPSNESFYDAVIKFNNYIPQDENLQENVEPIKYFRQIENIEKQMGKKVRNAVKDFVNLDKSTLSIFPDVHNVDIKRLLSHKLSKLNTQTEEALAEIAISKKLAIDN